MRLSCVSVFIAVAACVAAVSGPAFVPRSTFVFVNAVPSCGYGLGGPPDWALGSSPRPSCASSGRCRRPIGVPAPACALGTPELDLLDINGGWLGRLTGLDAPAVYPTWRPAGAARLPELTFVRGHAIGAIAAGGRGFRQILAYTDARADALDEIIMWPTWSADGQMVAYSLARTPTNRSPTSQQIYLASSDGRTRTLLRGEPDAVWDSTPSFSPDGARIAFTQWTPDVGSLWVASADGSTARKVVNLPGYGTGLAWGPDDELAVSIVPFRSQRPFVTDIAEWHATAGIYLVRSDGTNLHRLVPDATDRPSWTADGRLLYIVREEFAPVAHLSTIRPADGAIQLVATLPPSALQPLASG